MKDDISEAAFRVVREAQEPLETKEVEKILAKYKRGVTRTKLFYRLNDLRGEGLIRGKSIGPGKGVWVWWRPEAFRKK